MIAADDRQRRPPPTSAADTPPLSPAAPTSIVIFAKAPVPGLGKTRLIPALGAAGAAALAERLLVHAVAAAAAARLGPVELCVTPDAQHACFQQLAFEYGLHLELQGDGDLGQRMHLALQRALQSHSRVLLMGADAPGLDAALLRQAAAALHSHDAVFVPALDGGYALVGLKQPQPGLFEGMIWSTARVMQDTRDRARDAGLSWLETAPVADIDVPGDLQHLPEGWTATVQPR